jgi:hypothetical protein
MNAMYAAMLAAADAKKKYGSTALDAIYGPPLTGYDILIVAGQSNATPRSTLPAVVATADTRISQWDAATQQIVAVTGGDTTTFGGTQWVGNEFAREYVNNTPGRKLLIVPTAVGSTGFTTSSLVTPPGGYHYTTDATKGTWDRTLVSDPMNHYANMISWANAAKAAAGAGAQFIGILWSQGESDRTYLTQAQYATKLDDLIAQARIDLASSILPFIIGSMTPETIWDNTGGTAEIDAALYSTPRRVQQTSYVWGPADLVEYGSGRIHWSPQGQAVRARVMARDGLYRARLNITGSNPVTPRNLAARRTSPTIVEVTWDYPPCRVTSFTVQSSTDGGTTWVTWPVLGDTAATRTAFYVDALATVLVRASTTNSVGTSDLTRAVTVLPAAGGAAIHAPGVTGFTHRYVGLATTVDVGRELTVWQDLVGTAHLQPAGTSPVGTSPKVRQSTTRYLEFDGINDTLKSDSMSTSVQTVIMVARARSTDSATTILASGTGVSINRNGASGTVLNPGVATNNTVKLDNQWRFVAAVATASVATLSIDGTKITATASGTWGTSLRLGANGTPGYWSPLDVAEVITYPTALSDGDVATIRTALQAVYTGMLL